ncbi:MAG: S8 family serine peptidase [Alistipes sp.]|nr:S8 family serine peptidase [Alistipes sp.]
MNKVKFLMFALAATIAVSCVNDPTSEQHSKTDAVIANKFVNTSQSALPGSLLIYVDEESADVLGASERGTRSGVSSIDDVVATIGATALDYALNMPVVTDVDREYGFHRWFEVRFPEDANIDEVAMQFAQLKEVQRVEFNTLLVQPKPQAHVVDMDALAAATRADAPYFNDPMLELQWHYKNTGNKKIHPEALEGADINVEPAWDYVKGNRDIIVAIVDEGVDYRHPDLKDNMWTNDKELNGAEGVDDDGNGYVDDIYGYNFVPGTNGKLTWDEKSVTGDPNDDDVGHGTHVAGTVAAVNNNGIGVAGVAGGSGNGDGVRLMSCQIFSAGRNAPLSTNADAIRYAANHGACILQCSWGYPKEYNPQNDDEYEQQRGLQQDAIRLFINTKNCAALDGGIVIFAAGNDAMACSSYPAAYNEFISVTAYAPNGLPTTYTNYGPGCNVAAPGGDYYANLSTMQWEESGLVLSTLPNNTYGYMPGTSMACPHVSGIAALVLSHALELGKTLSLSQLKTILLTSVNDIDSRLTGTYETILGKMNLNSYKGKMGTGTIDAYRAIMALRGTTCYAAEVGKEVEIDINKLVGDGNLSMKVLKSVEIPADVATRLGITDSAVFGNKLYLTCTKAGGGVITMHAVAGGDSVGGGSTMGGMDIAIELAIIARPNNDREGWL